MHDLIAFIGSNSALVVANPAAFATFAVLFAGGGFAVERYLLTERIANLESRIARRDEEITHLKAKQTAPELESSMMPIIGTTALFPNEPEPSPLIGAWPNGKIAYQIICSHSRKHRS
ncbi:hypothetical protein LB577_20260 [Mesorhizobium sp. B283B1A]|uniref:hypothetical protein n=1 Tax=Mesorhizobium TaxID=68287 RepID=UPI001CD0B34A|nr:MULTISPECIES: hypothetical protein [Mesorhizobium]MCA0049257.1 hypothetical protein [Mesorhizobium sp. B283B1A]UQS64409.1 hypothetical protein M5D98_30705 [Mesorhizobium opportunistum]